MASKYRPLYQFLANLEADEWPTTFTEIERILDFRLTNAARKYQAWWANDVSHSHARTWLDAGWKTRAAKPNRESVVFVRTRSSQHSAGTAPIRKGRRPQRDDRYVPRATRNTPAVTVAKSASDTIRLLDYVFVHGAVIEPERGSDGAPLEFMPQSKYSGADTMRLNRYGAGPFCRFAVRVRGLPPTPGVYALTIDGALVYVGIAQDLAQRWGPQGYASISPRACYVGGQSTNCKVNSNILRAAREGRRIDLWIHETPGPAPIEARLIRALSPPWNGQQPTG